MVVDFLICLFLNHGLVLLCYRRYAMVCLELYSLAKPWKGLTRSAIKHAVVRRERPAIPREIPSDLVVIIEQGWAHEWSDRPSAAKLKRMLLIGGEVRRRIRLLR